MSPYRGFSPSDVEAILIRDGGICAMWGPSPVGPGNPRCRRRASTANHRLNRKAGGSRLRNGLGNGCAICDPCNDALESDAVIAESGRERGAKLREGDDPDRPMWHPFYGQFVRLTDDALYFLGSTREDNTQ